MAVTGGVRSTQVTGKPITSDAFTHSHLTEFDPALGFGLFPTFVQFQFRFSQ